MSTKILIPIDVNHAEVSDSMLKQVKELSDQSDTNIVLLNVIPEIPPYVAIQLPEDVGQIVAKDAHTSLDLLIKQGNPAHQILQTASDENVDLIVIGSHQPGLVDYLIGSVAARVVRHATCSVLVVR